MCRLLIQILQHALCAYINKCTPAHEPGTLVYPAAYLFLQCALSGFLPNFGVLTMCHISVAMKLASPRKLSSLFTECFLVALGADDLALWSRDIVLSASARNTEVTLFLFPSMS